MAASLLLFISGTLALFAPAAEEDPQAGNLIARGWLPIESDLPCGAVRAQAFYEISNDTTSAEAFYLGQGKFLVSHATLPEAPISCREIPEPHFIEEIL